MIRYAHTNIIARDVQSLTRFYRTALHCKSIGETRDLKGKWLDDLTNLQDAHITGEHLLLPGCDGAKQPTLEIFSYDELKEAESPAINRPGIAHIAFEVDDVEAVLSDIIRAGGSALGQMITTPYPNGRQAVFVYVTDPEGNIIELQSWQ